MGKYMKKSKITGDVAVMEVSLSPQCSLGVRTRAKTLALQRQQQQQQEKQHQKSILSPVVDSSSFCYLELRSRRLEKPPRLGDGKKENQRNQESPRADRCCGGNPSLQILELPNSRVRVESEEKEAVALEGDEVEDFNDVVLEASFGENKLEFEGRDRSTRESTPCSLIRGSDTLGTPGSTTRRKSTCTAADQRVRNDMQRSIPTTHEMNEFFVFAEQQQQRIFIEKYNFDIVNDSPLPGRYEWMQVIP